MQVAPTSTNQKAHWWKITTHPARAPLNLDMGKQSQKLLHFLARPIIGLGAQTLNKKTINHNWAPPATAKRPQINTGKFYPFRSRSITRPVLTIHAVRRRQSCILQDNGSLRYNVYGTNRKVPSYIMQGQ